MFFFDSFSAVACSHKLNSNKFIKLFGETSNFPFLNTHRKKSESKKFKVFHFLNNKVWTMNL